MTDIKQQIFELMRGYSYQQKWSLYSAYINLMVIVDDPFSRDNLSETRRLIESSMDLWERMDEDTKRAIREEIIL